MTDDYGDDPPEMDRADYERGREIDDGLLADAEARAAADRRRYRKEPLTRREALNEAPWHPTLSADEHRWRRAYADRLIERGLALPSSTGRSGPSGQALHPKVEVRIPVDAQRRYRAAAEREGVSLSEWIRRAAEERVADKSPSGDGGGLPEPRDLGGTGRDDSRNQRQHNDPALPRRK